MIDATLPVAVQEAAVAATTPAEDADAAATFGALVAQLLGVVPAPDIAPATTPEPVVDTVAGVEPPAVASSAAVVTDLVAPPAADALATPPPGGPPAAEPPAPVDVLAGTAPAPAPASPVDIAPDAAPATAPAAMAAEAPVTLTVEAPAADLGQELVAPAPTDQPAPAPTAEDPAEPALDPAASAVPDPAIDAAPHLPGRTTSSGEEREGATGRGDEPTTPEPAVVDTATAEPVGAPPAGARAPEVDRPGSDTPEPAPVLLAADPSTRAAPSAPSPPGSPATPVVVEAPAFQVAAALRNVRLDEDGRHELSFDLHPAELGAVSVDVVVDGGRVNVVLRAEQPAAVDLLRSELDQLRQLLADGGLDVGDLSLGHHGERNRPGERPSTAGGDDRRPAATALPTLRDLRSSDGRAVDVLL